MKADLERLVEEIGLLITRAARTDIRQAVRSIARDNPAAAIRLSTDVVTILDLIASHRLIGNERPGAPHGPLGP